MALQSCSFVQFGPKGMTINDLGGAEEIFEMNLFFPDNLFRRTLFIVSWRVPLKIYFFPEKGLRIFFLDFLCPRSLMAVP